MADKPGRPAALSAGSSASATQWLEVNNVSLRVELGGSGPGTLVLLHGQQLSLESWDEILPALRAGHRVLRYDLRGFGLSEKIRGNLTIDDEVNDLVALLDALQIREPVTLIGESVGGAIALKFAAANPGRVRALVVTNPAAYLQPQMERVASAAGSENQSPRVTVERGAEASYPAEIRAPDRYARFRSMLLANDPSSVAATTRMIYSTAFADLLPKIQCPALVIATALYPRPVASFKELANAMPKGEFVVLQTGQFASLESPELLLPVLQKFLEAHAGS